jgi:hypothetical protein
MVFLGKQKIASSFKKGGSAAAAPATNLKQVENRLIIKLTFFIVENKVNRSLFEPYLIANRGLRNPYPPASYPLMRSINIASI